MLVLMYADDPWISIRPCICRFDPLWNSIVLGGIQDGKPFLGTIGMLGVNYQDAHIATGDSLSPFLSRKVYLATLKIEAFLAMSAFMQTRSCSNIDHLRPSVCGLHSVSYICIHLLEFSLIMGQCLRTCTDIFTTLQSLR